MSVDFLGYFKISNLVLLYLENIFYIASILKLTENYFMSLAFGLSWRNVPCVPEKNVYSAIDWSNVLYISTESS